MSLRSLSCTFSFFFFHREKKISRSSALKVLDHAMIGPEGTDNCHKFVDILGLRTIFPLFMKSPKKIKKVGTTEKEHEGTSVASPIAAPAAPSPVQPACSLLLCWLLMTHLPCLFWYQQFLAIPFHVLLISYFTPVGSVV